MSNTPRYLTSDDIAKNLQVSKRTAQKYMQQMVHLQNGRVLRVTESAYHAWLDRNSFGGSCPSYSGKRVARFGMRISARSVVAKKAPIASTTKPQKENSDSSSARRYQRLVEKLRKGQGKP